MTLAALPSVLIEPLVRAALLEDLGGAGDITTASTVPEKTCARAIIATRQDGVVAGIDCAIEAFHLLDPQIDIAIHRPDGTKVAAGETIATITGLARPILSGERVALNFMGHLSGVASATAALVEAIAGQRARIICTRKTTPGLRALEKYAVRAGGGINHRFGLHDGVLIKDNHIAAAGGLRPAIERARHAIGHMVKIEAEVESLQQLEEALSIGVDAVLLDNMTPKMLADAVKAIAGRAISEASGRVTRETVRDIAATGVDLISVGWITHSAPVLDLGLDFPSD